MQCGDWRMECWRENAETAVIAHALGSRRFLLGILVLQALPELPGRVWILGLPGVLAVLVFAPRWRLPAGCGRISVGAVVGAAACPVTGGTGRRRYVGGGLDRRHPRS